MSVIDATGVDGCNILIFEGEKYAYAVADKAKELHIIDPELAKEYVKAMKGVHLEMSDNTATFDNSK